MQANEFVKKFGLDKAELLLSTQGKTIESLKDEYTPSQLKEFQKYVVSDRLISLDKLKRIVESHKLVERYDSVDEAKEYLPMLRMDSYDELKQAIADVESCL